MRYDEQYAEERRQELERYDRTIQKVQDDLQKNQKELEGMERQKPEFFAQAMLDNQTDKIAEFKSKLAEYRESCDDLKIALEGLQSIKDRRTKQTGNEMQWLKKARKVVDQAYDNLQTGEVGNHSYSGKSDSDFKAAVLHELSSWREEARKLGEEEELLAKVNESGIQVGQEVKNE